ncbi:MAG TPA: Ig-like domain-containing protein [Chryseolinea sp.]
MKRIVPQLQVGFFIFMIFILLGGCRQYGDQPTVSVISKNDKVVGMLIRGTRVKGEEMPQRLKIQLIKSGERVAILGNFSKHNGEVLFEPLVPFTKGLEYEILLDDTVFGAIEIPKDPVRSPELLFVYPSNDTLPENLLKIYIEFSEPMVEGNSLEHLMLVRNDHDTLPGTFLDLQPELWNVEATVLTLWLDPGRIKRDLIPNKEMGAPLESGHKYTLHIDNAWRSKRGDRLLKSYEKTFVTVPRDDTSPKVANWKIQAPRANQNSPLEIQFPEPLDYFLLKESITVKSAGKVVSGTIEIEVEERVLRFLPDKPWEGSRYVISVEGRLEDLAGNNLNRPFDRIVGDSAEYDEMDFFTREFSVD